MTFPAFDHLNPSGSDPDHVEQSLEFVLAKACQLVFAICKEELTAYGITSSQFIVLMHMEEGSASDSQVCLSHRTGIDRTTIVGIIDRLERKGLVARAKVAQDRRVRQVVLTQHGLELKKHLCKVAERVRTRLTTRISQQEYAEVVRLLTRLLD